jgi:hypothetical protein
MSILEEKKKFKCSGLCPPRDSNNYHDSWQSNHDFLKSLLSKEGNLHEGVVETRNLKDVRLKSNCVQIEEHTTDVKNTNIHQGKCNYSFFFF